MYFHKSINCLPLTNNGLNINFLYQFKVTTINQTFSKNNFDLILFLSFHFIQTFINAYLDRFNRLYFVDILVNHRNIYTKN